MNLDEFRARFPILRRRIYVNSCSQGALSTDVDEAMRAYLDSWHESGSPWELWVERSETARQAFAGLINADPNEVADCTSVSPISNSSFSLVGVALTSKKNLDFAVTISKS